MHQAWSPIDQTFPGFLVERSMARDTDRVDRSGDGWSALDLACPYAVGQRRLPYEQKTQQSPGFGRSNAPHSGHVQKYWQAPSGINASVLDPQHGQVMTAVLIR